ncbi:hypothetical protein NUU61_005352 [Penicillium alfredii]|uniref:Mid2 domain-containing protein n=1 Tax=Penicillium alfredii TaxID=1506179 RepID=A0A9W9F9E0_9EURO|nr:uncharacterized protein NUU61_005352 [Penicillium alfredii]KAJ5095996.1 hypothetical protein NUU61_005352 [Penicillium alfredii]
MRRLQLVFLAFHALTFFSLIPPTHAWTFVWRNATNVPAVEDGHHSQPCKQIHNPQGKQFEWDAEEEPFTIYLYGNSDCAGTPGGRATHWLGKNASEPIRSFKVDDTPSLTTTVSSDQTPTTTTTTSSESATSSTSSPSSSSSSKSSLSGGAIAGIVIGVVGGVAIIGSALYWFGRCHQEQKAAAGGSMGYAPPAMPGPGLGPFKEREKPSTSMTESSINPGPQPPGGTLVAELPEGYRVVELSNGTAVSELSGRNEVNELESPLERQRPYT